MPELPETETIARDLHDAIVNAVIIDVAVQRADVLREVSSQTLTAAVDHARILRVWRRAKNVVLDLAIGTKTTPSSHLVVQPRFTGSLLLDDGTLPPDRLDYLAVTFALQDGRSLHYRDVRRLGTVAWMSAKRFDEYEAKLGREPLDVALTDAEFSALVRASRRSVKAVLMDQSRLAGVGNIYANEALWLAGIDPSREAADLGDDETARLLRELRAVLRASIAARGTSFRDYRDARGQRGDFLSQLSVYGRGGEPCLRCGKRLIETHAVDGRTTVFCAVCQS
ncbi:MAG: bifunctional DNA-formamidopyrimidine glycosylase/DNA-(apurinic or apyrimidinic site) lyase [Gemmatimonadaceae bacterium]